MPRIPNLPKKKSWKEYARYTKQSKRDNVVHNLVYNTTTWRLLRMEKLRNNPLCERCEAMGKIVSAVEVHHIVPISEGVTDQDKQAIGFDYYNLMSLCKECHKIIHNK